MSIRRPVVRAIACGTSNTEAGAGLGGLSCGRAEGNGKGLADGEVGGKRESLVGSLVGFGEAGVGALRWIIVAGNGNENVEAGMGGREVGDSDVAGRNKARGADEGRGRDRTGYKTYKIGYTYAGTLQLLIIWVDQAR
jgi:hypothetical protein